MNLPSTRQHVARNVQELIQVINTKLQDRGKIASGALLRNNSAIVSADGNVVLGIGYALDYWTTAGSGTPPGTNVDLVDIYRWAQVKGLGGNPKQTARFAQRIKARIYSSGSREYRNKGVNLYLETIDELDKRGAFNPIDAAEQDITAPVDKGFNNLK